jgi:hypothetical protein
MTSRIGPVLLAATLALLGGPASAQQARPPADAKAAPPKPAAPAASGLAVPQPEVLLLLIRSALIALDHANRTGNYTVLRELGGPGLQRHPSLQLANIFANLRAQKVDLLPAAVVTPQLTQPPSVSPEGLLQLVGYFPTQPRQIQFQIVYQPADGQWKLYGLNVNVVTVQAPAPQASTAPPPPKAAPSKK